MRSGGTLFALIGSLMLLFLLRMLWCPADAPARSRLLMEGSREDTSGTSAALKTLWSPTTPVPRTRNSTYLDEKTTQITEKCKDLQYSLNSLSNKTRRYSEDDYLQTITNIQRCPWNRQAEEYDNFRCPAFYSLSISLWA